MPDEIFADESNTWISFFKFSFQIGYVSQVTHFQEPTTQSFEVLLSNSENHSYREATIFGFEKYQQNHDDLGNVVGCF